MKIFQSMLLSAIQLALGIALIAWGIAGGYQNYQGDRCNDAFASLLASNQVRIDDVRARIEKLHARDAALQARVAEVAKKFSERTNDGK
jgi:hypothetical protein